ncbi:helix-turn-helix domain-containing protein [Thalassomonas sp. RHCl1]|uniref:GlxA family transcriptional regulator n=1 Tax=Thalassomonas sp. RHCl1 TaxID=2995320 RepID=UPI00248B88C0|nr:helix-turn-helix domain-containing protein [Thalassomonas sp. RHCl1]
MKVAILASELCMVSGVYGMLDVFSAANYCQNKRYGLDKREAIDCQIVTIDDKPVTGYNGIEIKPTRTLAAMEIPDVIIATASVQVVVGCCGHDIELTHKAKIKHWLQTCQSQGTLIASSCTGSFLLASIGMLAGKTATTHWRSAELFRKIFPFIRLDCEELLIDNGDVICAGGSTSYMDLALYLVEKLLGKDSASDCAKLMVFDPVRQKQSPYGSFKAQKSHEDQAILTAQEWLERNYKKEISMDALAEQVGLGSRTFKRRFKLATGENPITYLQRIRVELAKGKLEKTTDSINNIIWSVGYEDISSFRQLFKRFTGLTPKDYRQKFANLH